MTKPGLRRELKLRDLLLYGIIVIQPTAPLGSFGVVATVAQGHVATTILIGMFAMVLTAISYGRMSNAYPHAGSAYSYVSRELNPHLGFLTGWSIGLDYLLNPTIGTIWCAKAAMKLSGLGKRGARGRCFATNSAEVMAALRNVLAKLRALSGSLVDVSALRKSLQDIIELEKQQARNVDRLTKDELDRLKSPLITSNVGLVVAGGFPLAEFCRF